MRALENILKNCHIKARPHEWILEKLPVLSEDRFNYKDGACQRSRWSNKTCYSIKTANNAQRAMMCSSVAKEFLESVVAKRLWGLRAHEILSIELSLPRLSCDIFLSHERLSPQEARIDGWSGVVD